MSRRRRVWGEVWRLGLGGFCGVIAWLGVMAEGRTRFYQDGDLWPFVDLALGALSLVVLLYRRRWPWAVATVLAVISAFALSPVGAGGIAMISLCTHRNWRQIVPTGVIWTVAGIVFAVIFPSDDTFTDRLTNLVFAVLASAFCIAAGLAIGARRELVAGLRERVETAEREQSLRVAQSKVAERARIAREMHDVLAHRISLVAMHSGALTYREDLSRDEVREAAAVIQSNAHTALTELREVLGVLRATDQDDARPEAPQPILGDLPDLIDAARMAGTDVRLDLAADVASMPEVLSRNAFRIIQEGLTNARKHAPGQPVTIAVHGEAGDRLSLEVTNPVPHEDTATAVPGAGLGLLGLTERAVLSGGELRYGVDRKQDFTLSAWLPWST
ncbi:hypothetical protein VV01_06825 [Luteipulveratus halotolerans]|uniref:histidine kinase n=2 Tax=Luteipulveratus halotolerans TaxID=1631356 RepID=A0A0L6CNZ0_9MICO|nr:hypothetical protein VV01_06825 [Luteipulveratus halotolerans]